MSSASVLMLMWQMQLSNHSSNLGGEKCATEVKLEILVSIPCKGGVPCRLLGVQKASKRCPVNSVWILVYII